MIKISKLTRNEITTKNGPATKIFITTDKGQKASGFEKLGITDKWREGDEVDAHIVEQNGYFNIVLGTGNQNSPSNEQKPAKTETSQSGTSLLLEAILCEIKAIRAFLEANNGQG